MIDQLRRIAEKYGIGAEARQELEALLGAPLALAPTRRILDHEEDEEAPPLSTSICRRRGKRPKTGTRTSAVSASAGSARSARCWTAMSGGGSRARSSS